MRPNEPTFVVLRLRRISKKSLSRRIMRPVRIFILETHNDPNYLRAGYIRLTSLHVAIVCIGNFSC